MNRRWISPLVIAVLAAALAFGAVRQYGCRSGQAVGMSQLDDLASLTRSLDLRPEQAAAIREIHRDLASALGDCCARHCGARAELARAVLASTNDTSEVENHLRAMTRAYEDGERATLEQIRRVRAVLDATQRPRFDAMITDCMCSSCGSGVRSAGKALSP